MFDSDYLDRMKLLYELAQKSPKKPMRKLQREALKYYPLYHVKNQRAWLSTDTAFKCFRMHCPLHKQQGAE
jgi:hypothetical protein